MSSPFSRHSFRNPIRINSENSFICIHVFSMILTDSNFLPYFIIDDSRWNNLLGISLSKYRDLHFNKFWNLSIYLSLYHVMIVISTWMNLITLYAYLRPFFCVVFNSIASFITSSIIICTLSVPYFHEALCCSSSSFAFSFLSHSLIFSLPTSTFRETCFTVDSLDGPKETKMV